jgi:hypothetical protein
VNAREQLLKKRVESLEGQLEASLELLGRVLGENEYLASVACAFAWDLQIVLNNPQRFDRDEISLGAVEYDVTHAWASAVEEASK